MATLKEIQVRIRSVKSTRQITKAMEMVAAAKMRRAQSRAVEARPYAERMNAMLQSLAEGSTGEISHPYFEAREVKKRTVVVVTSDRGLCGSFNSSILRIADSFLAQCGAEGVEVFTVGRRCLDYYRRRKWTIVESQTDWGGQMQFAGAKEIVSFLTNRFTSGQTDAVHVIYARFISTVKYKVVNEVYLPIPRPLASAATATARKEYIFEPTPESIYANLMPSYALTKMVTALLDSFASEHSARMIAMNSATKNAGEMINALTLQFNKVRQAKITKEILEVVGGAEALKG